MFVLRFFIPFLLTLSWGHAQLLADFKTTQGDFSVSLDYLSAPLACANFVLLAGKGDDVWETPAGASSITSSRYRSTAESDAPRLELRVELVPAPVNAPPTEARYDIYQQSTYLGSVGYLQTTGAHRDITGAGRFELRQIAFSPNKYQIKFIYPRPWLDSQTQTVKDAPMYKNIPITRIERGKRFFSGSFTNNAFDHPGYQFQDENVLTPGNLLNPYGTPFNSPWILAMDSTGPNTNGSRFFITTTPEPAWNGKYTAIGVVLQNIGRQVLLDLVQEDVDAEGIPLNSMKVLSISIRHLGGAAAFFESFHQDKLPGLITSLPLSFDSSDGGFQLITPLRPRSQTLIFQSFDLIDFETAGFLSQSPYVTEPPSSDLSPLLASTPKLFLKGFSTAMPNWPSDEIDFSGARLALKINSDNGSGTLNLNFSEDGTAAVYTVDTVAEQFVPGGDPVTYVAQGEGRVFVDYSPEAGPYKGTLTFTGITGPLDVDELTLHFQSPSVVSSAVVRSFSARKLGTGPFFYGYSGIFQTLK